jgi:lipopolysaccharide heptosyltransferase II
MLARIYTTLARGQSREPPIIAALPTFSPQRILLIDWSMIGDLIMLSPAIRAIRRRYPEAHLALLGQPSSLAAYKQHPEIAELIPYDRSRGDWNLEAFFGTVKLIQQGHYDLAFIFHNSFGSALMAKLGRVRERVGYSAEWRGPLLTKTIARPREREHLIQTKLHLLAGYGLEVEDMREEVFIDVSAAKSWLKAKLGPNFGRNRPVVTIGMGATLPYKQWSADALNQFLALLPLNSCDLVFIGAPSERKLYEGVYSYNNTVVDLVGETTIEELSWVLDRADLHLGPDSGPMHLAIGRATPVVALFGATDPARCGPFCFDQARVVRGDRCCVDCERQYGRQIAACVHTITAQEAYEAARSLLPALVAAS